MLRKIQLHRIYTRNVGIYMEYLVVRNIYMEGWYIFGIPCWIVCYNMALLSALGVIYDIAIHLGFIQYSTKE